MSEVLVGRSPASFRDRLRNGLGGSTKLVDQTWFPTLDAVQDRIETQEKGSRFLPHDEIAE